VPLVPPTHVALQDLPDIAGVRNATCLRARFHGIEKLLGQAHIELRRLRLELEPNRYESRQIVFAEIGSYSLRSASSTKRSASSSVLKVGIFFFIPRDLLSVHIPSADRPDVALPTAFADRENEKNRSSARAPDRLKSLLGRRMPDIRSHG
jgi:hypothetical protein